jgi:hypothetical protein
VRLTPEEFVTALSANPYGKQNALLIGFEGSARLLGNDLAAEALKRMGVLSTGSSIQPNEVYRTWNNLGREGRTAFLRDGFSSTKPNADAIQHLTHIIERARVGIIIATDPVCALQVLLQEAGILEPHASFNFCQGKLEKFRDWRESIGGRLIFADAGETLIEGLVPGLFDLQAAEMKVIHDKLKENSGLYDKTICWGWSPFNTKVEKLWTSEKGHYFLIGNDSNHTKTFMDYDPEVADTGSNYTEIASLGLLRAISERFPAQPSSPPQRRSARSVSHQPAERKYEPIPLLCSEHFAAEILKESRNSRVSVIGIDGRLVRSRLAARLVRLLLQDKEMVEHEVIGNLRVLAEKTADLEGEQGPLFWVVEVVGATETLTLRQAYLQELTKTLNTLSSVRTILLVPIFYAEEITQSARNINFYGESLTFDKIFNSPRLLEWMEEVLPDRMIFDDDENENTLVADMCEVVYEMKDQFDCDDGLDRIHLALNRWWRMLTRWKVNSSTNYLEAWRSALEAFPMRHPDDLGAGESDFSDFEFHPRFVTSPAGEDWELQFASRRSRPRD